VGKPGGGIDQQGNSTDHRGDAIEQPGLVLEQPGGSVDVRAMPLSNREMVGDGIGLEMCVPGCSLRPIG